MENEDIWPEEKLAENNREQIRHIKWFASKHPEYSLEDEFKYWIKRWGKLFGDQCKKREEK